MVKKIEMKIFGSQGWKFIINSKVEYRTNEFGKGLWVLENNGYKQLKGTEQFSLQKDRDKAYKQIYHWYGFKLRNGLDMGMGCNSNEF